jgi:RNA polymerase sigma-70 factor, ECF subfamily
MRTAPCAAWLKTQPDQQAHLDREDFRTVLAKLLAYQRKVLLLVGAHGMSYDEAAEVCKVAVGPIKSRVSRARFRLTALMGREDEAEIGPDSVMRATLAVE